MEDFKLLIDLHKNAYRQGPGSDTETEKALDLAGIDRSLPLKIADIGCGTGASTLLLARLLNAQITAVDFLPEFLDVLEGRAKAAGIADRISTLSTSMDNLPFENDQFDIIWSEGAIYNIGFKNGVEYWKKFLKPGGSLVVSEITWLTESRPEELQKHWDAEYPEVDLASAKIAILEKSGFSPAGYFYLPEYCWFENYYQPMQNRFDDFLKRNGHSEKAKAITEAEKIEIKLFEKYKDYFSYGVYVAKKIKS